MPTSRTGSAPWVADNDSGCRQQRRPTAKSDPPALAKTTAAMPEPADRWRDGRGVARSSPSSPAWRYGSLLDVSSSQPDPVCAPVEGAVRRLVAAPIGRSPQSRGGERHRIRNRLRPCDRARCRAGLCDGDQPAVQDQLDPWVSFFYSSPLVALTPFFILVFGVGIASKVAIIFIVSIFPILLNALPALAPPMPPWWRSERRSIARDGNLRRIRAGGTAVHRGRPELGIGRALTGWSWPNCSGRRPAWAG